MRFYRLAFLTVILAIIAIGSAKADGLDIHPNLKLSFSERFRLVSWDNAITLSDTALGGNSFTRHRTSIMAKWFPETHFEFGIKLTNEFRYYFIPEDRKFDFDEIFFDQLYLKWIGKISIPVTFTIGRQNIMLGEGFMVMDGHPLDGSRSIYFNAIRLDAELISSSRLTLFGSYQPITDDILPRVHDSEKRLVENAERGLGIYFNGTYGKYNIQPYLLRKTIKESIGTSDESAINALGGRITALMNDKLTFTTEVAYQGGDRGGVSWSAFGGYSYATFSTDWSGYLPRRIKGGAVYLSGDDRNTEKWEGWDPLFARWPKWSESYIYTLIQEGGVAYWSNMISFYCHVQSNPTKSVQCEMTYHHLLSAEKPDVNDRFPGGNSCTRGDLFIGKLTYKINKQIRGHLLWELFWPGNYYFENADYSSWLRTEMLYQI